MRWLKYGGLALLGLLVIGYVGVIVSNSMGKEPEYLGVHDGRLSPVDASKPNNVSSYEAGKYPKMEPLHYSDDQAAAKARLLAIVDGMPRSQLVTDEGDYIHVTFKSRIFRFVDDTEFLFDDDKKEINFRSAARTGYGDMNVNRKRMEDIRQQFEQ